MTSAVAPNLANHIDDIPTSSSVALEIEPERAPSYGRAQVQLLLRARASPYVPRRLGWDLRSTSGGCLPSLAIVGERAPVSERAVTHDVAHRAVELLGLTSPCVRALATFEAREHAAVCLASGARRRCREGSASARSIRPSRHVRPKPRRGGKRRDRQAGRSP